MKSQGEAVEVCLQLFAAWRLCAIIFFQHVEDSRDAVFDRCHVEVDEQATALAGEPQVGQKLFFWNCWLAHRADPAGSTHTP